MSLEKYRYVRLLFDVVIFCHSSRLPSSLPFHIEININENT